MKKSAKPSINAVLVLAVMTILAPGAFALLALFT